MKIQILFLSALFILSAGVIATTATADTFDDIEACKRQCSPECQRLESQLSRSLRELHDSCRGDNGDGRTPPDSSVAIYRSDSCSSGLIANITPSTNCDNLEKSGSSAWGVRVNGECMNIPDTSVANACLAFAGGAHRDGVKLYHSDSCARNNVMAIVSSRSDCGRMSDSGTEVWAVEIGGQCQNISDTSLRKACAAFSSGNTPNSTKIYHSDTCSAGSLIGIVTRRTDCSTFSNVGSEAWGIEINGRCENISDTNLRDACERFKN